MASKKKRFPARHYYSNALIMIKRRLGPDPHANGHQTEALSGCPDIFELEDGGIAVIGQTITERASPHLPCDASCGPDESIVRIPRRTLILAKEDVLDLQ